MSIRLFIDTGGPTRFDEKLKSCVSRNLITLSPAHPASTVCDADLDADYTEEDDELDDVDVQTGDQQQGQESSTSIITKPPKPRKASSETSSVRKSIQRKVRKRAHYLMRNFKSQRMAERHGEALGVHARGLSLVAISKSQSMHRQLHKSIRHSV